PSMPSNIEKHVARWTWNWHMIRGAAATAAMDGTATPRQALLIRLVESYEDQASVVDDALVMQRLRSARKKKMRESHEVPREENLSDVELLGDLRLAAADPFKFIQTLSVEAGGTIAPRDRALRDLMGRRDRGEFLV